MIVFNLLKKVISPLLLRRHVQKSAFCFISSNVLQITSCGLFATSAVDKFKSSSNFRRTFLLAFYTAMILLRTVLNREIWFDPLGKIFGGWGLYEDGQFTTESIENFMLFVPFSILLLWAFQKELLDESENIRFGKTVWEATKVVAVFSFMIEFTQLLFHLGTFQISDLTYNTLGGAVGGVIYYLGYFRKRKK